MIAERIKIIKGHVAEVESNKVSSLQEFDWVANEIILTVIVNGEILTSFSCSPVHLEEMAVGFLFSNEIISAINDIESLKLCTEGNRVSFLLKKNIQFNHKQWQSNQTLTSGCGYGKSLNVNFNRMSITKITSELKVSAGRICNLYADLKNISIGYEQTGCIHIAALIADNGPTLVREDIGRHNAIDKVLGAGLRTGIDFSNYILCCSGRISSDMILKGGRAGIPIVISRAAPTVLAVEIANELGITLVGFVRGRRLNIYTHHERILMNNELNALQVPKLEAEIVN